jgi:hypothetical protein
MMMAQNRLSVTYFHGHRAAYSSYDDFKMYYAVPRGIHNAEHFSMEVRRCSVENSPAKNKWSGKLDETDPLHGLICLAGTDSSRPVNKMRV